MCKLLFVTGSLTPEQVHNLIYAGNSLFQGERDGFGFLAAGKDGFATGHYEDPAKFAGFKADMPNFLVKDQKENGEIPEETHTLMVHGRTSTNIQGLVGCHPFEYKNYHLAHNGMVNYIGQGEKPVGDVDSDQFLHWLVDNNFNWDDTMKNWAGWGAIGLYNTERQVFTIALDGASLYIARRADGGWVMATCKDHLEQIADFAGLTLNSHPISFPRSIATFRGAEILSERKWWGFGSRAMTANDWRARGGKKKKKYSNVSHGQYKLPEHVTLINGDNTEVIGENTQPAGEFPSYLNELERETLDKVSDYSG